MIKILIIIGKTASGKSEIVKRLVNKGFKKMITFTTRPIRKGEVDGIDYHFITDLEFREKIDNGSFFEYKTYQTKQGEWLYGSAYEDYFNANDKSVIILTPDGYKDYLNSINGKHMSLYIYANNQTIKERLIKRGDDKEEAKRRLDNDNDDFKGIETIVNRIVYNNKDKKIGDVVDEVITVYEKFLSKKKEENI